MAMYILGVMLLIHRLNHLARQLWLADDAYLTDLMAWWKKLNQLGPAFWYYPNASKTWLVVKEEHLELAQELFAAQGVKVATSGHKRIGSAIGDETYMDIFFQKKSRSGCVS